MDDKCYVGTHLSPIESARKRVSDCRNGCPDGICDDFSDLSKKEQLRQSPRLGLTLVGLYGVLVSIICLYQCSRIDDLQLQVVKRMQPPFALSPEYGANRSHQDGCDLCRSSSSRRSLSDNASRGYPVPNYVHFVYANKQDAVPDLPYWVYLNIAMAKDVQKPEKIFFHCVQEPRGRWWDRVKSWVEMHIIRDVMEIFGNPIYHSAHKADIIRMEVLLKYGGIYFDTDVLLLKNLTPLRAFPFVMGIEEHGVGLGNSVMISAPGATFLERWYEMYRTFDHTDWDYHSVQLPFHLSQAYPTDIVLVPKAGWFYPFGGVKIKLFGDSILDNSNHWAQHLFHNMVKSRLDVEVTGPSYFFRKRNTYTVAIVTRNTTDYPHVMEALTVGED